MEPPVAQYWCYRTPGPITIDGRLDEESWRAAPCTGNFALYSGESESPYQTSARMLWDEEYLYICFECDDIDLYATPKEREENLWAQDCVEVFIMEQSLGQGHFVEYQVSPIGAFFDTYNVDKYVGIEEWRSPGVRSAAEFDGSPNDPTDRDRGYCVEMAIPFDDLHLRKPTRATPDDGDTMRVNLCRIDYRSPETMGGKGAEPTFITWSPAFVLDFHLRTRFGVLTFVDGPAGTSAASQPAGRR